jgi:hypothetical protein
VRVTKGFKLLVDHVLHTTLPSFGLVGNSHSGGSGEEAIAPETSLDDDILASLASGSFGLGWEAATTTGTAATLAGLRTLPTPAAPPRPQFNVLTDGGGIEDEKVAAKPKVTPTPTASLVAAYQGLFASARSLGVRSLALPALGVGALNFPPELVARTAVAEAVKHARDHEGAQPLDIDFVLFDEPGVDLHAWLEALREAGAQDDVGVAPEVS